jgi:hypothetical protein
MAAIVEGFALTAGRSLAPARYPVALLMSESFVHKSTIAGCGYLPGRLPSGPHEEGCMSINNHGPDSRPSVLTRGFMLLVTMGVLVVGVAVLAVVRRAEPSGLESPSLSTSPKVHATTTAIADREAVIVRLREILRVRDRAYRDRDIGLLERIYTTDCPCLRGDGDAIRQLLQDDAIWVGASTSVRVQELDKVNNRLWIVVADFIASPFRIETESGKLIRAVEGKSELFRFALAKATNDKELLLGYAAAVDKAD